MPLRRVKDLPTWLLSRANARSQAVLGEAFTAAGARGYHFRLMAALEQYGALSQADLGRRTGIDRKDVALAVAELEDRGLLAREPDPSDLRRKVVTLTDRGKAELLRLDDIVAGVQEEVLAPLTQEERRILRELLAKLNDDGSATD